MKASPFPGMNPWLELYLGDVHHSLIQHARDGLQEHLPGDLVNEAYARGRYDHLDYSLGLEPPLLKDDAAWAQSLVSKGSEA